MQYVVCCQIRPQPLQQLQMPLAAPAASYDPWANKVVRFFAAYLCLHADGVVNVTCLC